MSTLHQRYHSDIKKEYLQGTLPVDIERKIPRSTRQRWREGVDKVFWMPIPSQNNVIDQFTIEKLKQENRRLKIQLKALFYLVILYKELVSLFSLKTRHAIQVKKRMKSLLRFCDENKLDKKIWRYLPFSSRQWNLWTGMRSCRNSLEGYCRRQNVFQLTLKEQSDLEEGCSQMELRNWPLSGIYYHLLRQGKINFSIGAFYKYCRLLKITRRKHKRRKKYVPLEASEPLKILHQDITIIRTLNGIKHYVYVIKDNFSRAILACKVTTEYSSRFARQTFEGVLYKFGLIRKDGFLITDDGAENKGELEEFLHKPGMLWQKLTAQLDVIQSNSMIEAANRILKQRYLLSKAVYNTRELKSELEKAVENFNSIPNGQLFGFSPNEVLAGAIPRRDQFKEQKYLAILKRKAENQNFNCKLNCHS